MAKVNQLNEETINQSIQTILSWKGLSKKQRQRGIASLKSALLRLNQKQDQEK
jgi:hypothetical protein